MKVVGIIQARMASTRLPAKVLTDLCGKPAIVRVLERVKPSRLMNEVWVATTNNPIDDPLAQCVESHGYPVFRGSEHNVLDRFYQTAKLSKADVIVRLTGDCPLHDAQVIDKVIQAYLESPEKPEYTSNFHPPTYPDGIDTEVIPFEALAEAVGVAHDTHSREHVGPAIYKHYLTNPADRPVKFNVSFEADFSHLRWTLDTQEDYEFIKTIYEHLLPVNPSFTWMDVVALLTRCPWMLKINSQYERNHTVPAVKKDRNMKFNTDDQK